MDNIDQILSQNPKAAKGFDAVKKAIEALNDLRKLGIASGPGEVRMPYGGHQNLEKLKSARSAKMISK